MHPAQVAARQDADFQRAEKSLLNQTWAYVARGGAPVSVEIDQCVRWFFANSFLGRPRGRAD